MLNSPMLSIFQHFHAIPLRSPLISLRSKWRLTGFSRRFTPKNPVRLHNPFGELPRWGAKNVLLLNLMALLPDGKGDLVERRFASIYIKGDARLRIILAPSSGRGRRAKRGGVGFPKCGNTVSRDQPPPLRGGGLPISQSLSPLVS